MVKQMKVLIKMIGEMLVLQEYNGIKILDGMRIV
jgi:hypothetical protein